MPTRTRNPLVHLELHSPDLPDASTFYAELFGWRRERVRTERGSYLALDLAGPIGGGIVQCPVPRSLWLPYVEVDDVHRTTERARAMGAAVLLPPREGPAGRRSVIGTRTGGEIALWQPKR